MPAEYIGQLTLGQCIPLAATMNATLDANLAIRLPEIAAKLAGALEAQARLTITLPSIGARIDALLDLIAGLQLALTLGLPGISLDLSILVSVIAQLQIDLGALQADIAASLSFGLTLGTPGVWVYSFTGTPAGYGPGFSAAIGSGLPSGDGANQPIGAVTFIVSDPSAWAAMKIAFGGAASGDIAVS